MVLSYFGVVHFSVKYLRKDYIDRAKKALEAKLKAESEAREAEWQQLHGKTEEPE